MIRNSFKLIAVCLALFLTLAAQSISFASSLDAYVYAGTTSAPKTLYIETSSKGDSIVDPNCWFYLTNGSWSFVSVWFDDFKVTNVNGITTTTATIEGYLNEVTPAIVTYTWTSFRSVNTLKIKMVDYYTGKVLNSINSYPVPYTSVTGFFTFK